MVKIGRGKKEKQEMATSPSGQHSRIEYDVDLVERIARRGIAAHPELEARIRKAIALVLECRVSPLGARTYRVEGCAGDYQVSLDGELTCTCPDHTHRGACCKHILAAGLYQQAQDHQARAAQASYRHPAPCTVDESARYALTQRLHVGICPASPTSQPTRGEALWMQARMRATLGAGAVAS